MAHNLHAEDLVQQQLLTILVGPDTTKSDSTHNTWFLSTLGSWDRFESEVRQEFLATTWSNEILGFGAGPHGPNHVNNEQLWCGDEHSVLARFGQNVEHVMTSVYQSLNINLRFGDFKACTDKGDITAEVPDRALLTTSGRACVLGEAKTPWVHRMSKAKQSDEVFRKYLGQIAKYMYFGRVRYGFWTNYEETIFLKQAPHPTRKNRWVLWHSPIISHKTCSILLTKNDFDDPALYRKKVSLRECFLFIARKAAGENSHVVNPMSDQKWCGSLLLRGLKGEDSDNISDADISSDTSGSASDSHSKSSGGRPSRPERRRPTRNPPPPTTESHRTTRSRSRAARAMEEMQELETRTGQLSLGGRAQAHRLPIATVYLDERSDQCFYVDDRGQEVPVTLSEGRDHAGTRVYLFIKGNTQYIARLEKRSRRHRK